MDSLLETHIDLIREELPSDLTEPFVITFSPLLHEVLVMNSSLDLYTSKD